MPKWEFLRENISNYICLPFAERQNKDAINRHADCPHLYYALGHFNTQIEFKTTVEGGKKLHMDYIDEWYGKKFYRTCRVALVSKQVFVFYQNKVHLWKQGVQSYKLLQHYFDLMKLFLLQQ